MALLFERWFVEQRAAFEQVLQGALGAEEWRPVTSTLFISASSVDLFQCFSQSIELFVLALQPDPAMLPFINRLMQEIVHLAWTA